MQVLTDSVDLRLLLDRLEEYKMIPPVFAIKDSQASGSYRQDSQNQEFRKQAPSFCDLSAKAASFSEGLDKTLAQAAKELPTPENFTATEAVLKEMLVKRTQNRDKLLLLRDKLVKYTSESLNTTRGS